MPCVPCETAADARLTLRPRRIPLILSFPFEAVGAALARARLLFIRCRGFVDHPPRKTRGGNDDSFGAGRPRLLSFASGPVRSATAALKRAVSFSPAIIF